MNWRIPPVGTWGGTSLLLAALSLPLFATAQSVAAPWQGLRTVGQGEMRWLWFKLYDATLYSESGRYQPGRYPQALSITYARAIERQDLLEATAAEWQQLGLGSESERQRWLARLATLWPDVAPGDKLVFMWTSRERATSGCEIASLALSMIPPSPPRFLPSG